MNTLQAIAEALSQGRAAKSDVALAEVSGLTRQSIARALSGDHNFSVTTLLAIAEANGQEVLIVDREVARAITNTAPGAVSVPTITSDLRNL